MDRIASSAELGLKISDRELFQERSLRSGPQKKPQSAEVRSGEAGEAEEPDPNNMVVLAASVVTKTGKGKRSGRPMGRGNATSRPHIVLLSLSRVVRFAYHRRFFSPLFPRLATTASRVPSVRGHDEDPHRGPARGVPEARQLRKAAHLRRHRERSIRVSAYGGECVRPPLNPPSSLPSPCPRLRDIAR